MQLERLPVPLWQRLWWRIERRRWKIFLLLLLISGSVAAISIPGYVGFHWRSKSSEARANLHFIATAFESHRVEHGVYPALHQISAEAFRAKYFRYACNSDAGNFTCAAIGDVDSDGHPAVFVYGSNNDGGDRLVTPIPLLGDLDHCRVGVTYAREVVSCSKGF